MQKNNFTDGVHLQGGFHLFIKVVLSMTIFFSCIGFVRANGDDDTKIWTSISHTSYFTKHLFVGFEEELRFINEEDEDEMDLYQSLFNVSAGWRFNKMFKLSLGYRTRAYDWDYIRSEYQASGYFSYEIIDDIYVNYRLRYHLKDVYEEDKDNKEYIRNKVGVSYELCKRIKPYLTCEGLYRFNYSKDSDFDEIRYTCGVSLDLPRKIDFDIYYCYQNEINVKRPKNAHVIGIGISLGKYKYQPKTE